MKGPETMQEYALQKTANLLDAMVGALRAAAVHPEPDAVHKMRVSIRRLQQALRLFRQYLKKSGVEKVKSHMRSVMQVAGELRNRDIAIELVERQSGDTSALVAQRSQWNQELAKVLSPYASPDLLPRWRRQLGLEQS